MADLVPADVLQKIQDGFSSYSRLGALIVDADGTPVTVGSGFSRFCTEFTRTHAKSRIRCEECDKNGAFLTLKNKQTTFYKCHAGLIDFSAPIVIEGVLFGSFIGGQVRTSEIDEEKMRKLAIEYEIDADEFIKAAKETAVLSMEQIQKAANFLAEITNAISSMAYQNYKKLQESRRMGKAAKSQADFVMDMATNISHAFTGWFGSIAATIDKTENEEERSLLSKVQREGNAVQSTLKSIIGYIQMSSETIVLDEANYKVADLATQIKNSAKDLLALKNIPIEIDIDKDVPKFLFGDAGRIGQIANFAIRALLAKKVEGSFHIDIKAKQISYATNLYIEIHDIKTGARKNVIQQLDASFAAGIDTQEYLKDIAKLDISFASVLVKKLSGKVNLEHDGENVVLKIRLPQLAGRENI